jgi:hypothetical protein
MNFSDDDLVVWADYLIDYAEDWDAHFKRYGKFFTQEYWYLLVGVTRAYWDAKPLNLTAAKDQMRGLQGKDDSVKDDRIAEAIDAGLIVKKKFAELEPPIQEQLGGADGRRIFLIPTPILERELRLHLSSTLGKAVETLRGFGKK